MSIENNKAIIHRLWEEVWNQNKLQVCDEIFDEAYARHESGYVSELRVAFPDLHFLHRRYDNGRQEMGRF